MFFLLSFKRTWVLMLVLLTMLPAVAQAPPGQETPAAAPAGVSLLPPDIHAFTPYGMGPDKASAEFVPVTAQPFTEAARLTTRKRPINPWDYGVTANIAAPLHKGDVLWISFWARRIESRTESGEALAEVVLEQTVGTRKVRPLERGLSFGPRWTQTCIPFVMQNDADAGTANIGIRFGYAPQVLEIGGVTLINCGPNAVLSALPRTVTRYAGYAPDAPWRKAAAARIEKYRKGDLRVRVTDAAGEPVANAQVQVRMKRSSFGWGTAVDPEWLTDSPDPDHMRYRKTVAQYFNKVVFENALKWGRWVDSPRDRENVTKALPWLHAHHIAVRGHVMVWPSWEHSPAFLEPMKNDPAALRKAIDDHIADQTKIMGGQLAEWDVINETLTNHDILDILGRDVMADWFREAHAGAPGVKLFYNDFNMFHGEGPGSPSQSFYDTVKFLKDKGAPVDAIGEQGHFGGSPAGLPAVITALDKFTELGLPIQISEFDIDTDDAGLQVDYMRDFMTAVFSEPSVIGVVQWGFWEKAHWLPRAALWDAHWNLRPHGQVWVDLTTKTWWTNADGHTKADGTYGVRGFYGDYEVTIINKGKSKTLPFTLSPQKGTLTVVM